MKTYLFSVLLVLLAGLHQQTFAAQDSSFSIITAIYEQSAPTAEHFGKVTNPSIKYQLSWIIRPPIFTLFDIDSKNFDEIKKDFIIKKILRAIFRRI